MKMNHDKIIKNLFVIFCFLQVADIATTYYSLYHLGLQEYNPGIRALMETAGVMVALMLLKTVGTVLTGFMIYILYERMRQQKYAGIAIMICCVFYIGVLANNLYWLVSQT